MGYSTSGSQCSLQGKSVYLNHPVILLIKACSRTRFRSEDLTVMLMDHASEGSRLKVTVRKTLGTTTVRMVCGGTEFNYQEALRDLFADALDEDNALDDRLSEGIRLLKLSTVYCLRGSRSRQGKRG